MPTIVPYTYEKKEERVIYFTSLLKGMKVLIATEKPFAKAAVDGMVEILEGAGHTVVRLEKYTDKTQLLDADYLRWIYDMMAADPQQGIFSVRFAQAGNMLLYKIGNIDLSLKVYRFCSRLTSVLRRK